MANRPPGQLRHVLWGLACASLVLEPAVAAQAGGERRAVTDHYRFQCIGRNKFTGMVDVPIEKQDDSGAWPFAAFFTDPVFGTPTIVYGPRFRALDPLMQVFIRRHECQHANGVPDEIAANCTALAQMRAQGLTAQQEAHLEHWHLAVGRLDPQYGGDGVAFWKSTVRCAARVR